MLFRVDEDTQRSKELLIVITATVIRSAEDARRMSVDQRDKTGLIPDSIKENPLMNKLQVRSAEDELGDEADDLEPDAEEDDFYGPQVDAYGPEIPTRIQPVGYEPEAG